MDPILRAYVPTEKPGFMPPCPDDCNCLGDTVVRGTPTQSELVGWLHADDCTVTEELLRRLGVMNPNDAESGA